MSGPLSLQGLALLPLTLAPDAPSTVYAASVLRQELAALGPALVGAGLPVRRPGRNDTPGSLIEECLYAELDRHSTPELAIRACLVKDLGCDEDYTMDAEDGEDDGLDDDAVTLVAYTRRLGTISFSALRAVLDAFEGRTGPKAEPLPLGLALHVACEQALSAALRICGPVMAMDLKTHDGMFDAHEEYDSIRDDLARERLILRDREKNRSRFQLPYDEVAAEVKTISDSEVEAYIAESEMLTLKRMYEQYGISRLPEYESVSLDGVRRIVTHAVRRGLPRTVAKTVYGWLDELRALQEEAENVKACVQALEESGDIARRLIYGFRPPTLILDVLGPGQLPGAEFVGSLLERVEERSENEHQNPDPEVPIAAALVTADNAGAALASFSALGRLEQRAGELFRRLSAWGVAELAHKEKAAAA